MRTNLSVPELSAASVPPAKPSPFALSIPPSTCRVLAAPLKLVLTGALPQITIPPQSPDCGFGEAEVNTMGSVGNPFACSLAPRVMINAATSVPLYEPLITVPGSMVMVALLTMYTSPLSMYVFCFFSTVSAPMRPCRVIVCPVVPLPLPPPFTITTWISPSDSILRQPLQAKVASAVKRNKDCFMIGCLTDKSY